MPVTRKEVANRAAVSEATVSYVINNGPRPVAPETRARVMQVIEELGYRPSDVARSLRKQRTSTIGLIVPDTANPFYGEIARIIENVSYAAGYTVILCNSSLDPEREANYVSLLLTRRVEGAVIMPTSAQSVADLRDGGIHTVVLEYEVPGAYCLVADDFEGGRALTEHLLQLGHRQIAFISRKHDTTSSRKRLDGFRSAMQAAGFRVLPQFLIEADPEIAGGESAARHLLDQDPPPTAIIAHNDAMAIGALSTLHRRGLRVPEDISVVGYDDIVQAGYTQPPLTTVANSKQYMGEMAARLLINLMQGAETPPPSTEVLGINLVVRASSAPPKAAPSPKGR